MCVSAFVRVCKRECKLVCKRACEWMNVCACLSVCVNKFCVNVCVTCV